MRRTDLIGYGRHVYFDAYHYCGNADKRLTFMPTTRGDFTPCGLIIRSMTACGLIEPSYIGPEHALGVSCNLYICSIR